MLSRFLIAFSIIICISIEIQAQCCSAGNPASVGGIQSKIDKGDLLFHTYFRHSHSKDYYNKSDKMDLNNIENSYYDFTNLSVTYGITDKFSINTEIGFFINKAQNINLSNSKEKIRATGFGDLGISIRYDVINDCDNFNQIVIHTGVNVPVGAFNETQNGIYIPISLQPSSGAFKLKSGVYYSRKINKRYGLLTMLNYQWSDRIDKEFLVYKYGDYLQFMGGAYYKPYKNLNCNGLIKYEYRGYDKRENNMLIQSTGGHVVNINTIVSYNIKTWLLIFNLDIPFYKYVNGYQLTNKYAVQFGIKKNIKK